MVPFAANALQCIVNGRKTLKTASASWDFVTPPEQDRATAIDNVHKKFGKDRACGSGDMLADRQTDSEGVSSFLTAHQHIIGHSVP